MADILINGKATPRLVVSRIRGKSMLPLLRPGQRIILETAISPRDLKRGEIIALRKGSGQSLVLHRFLGRTGTGRLLTRGDYSPLRDEPAPPGRFKGRLVCVEERPGQWCRLRPWTAPFFALTGSLRPARLVRRIHFFLTSHLPAKATIDVSMSEESKPEPHRTPADGQPRFESQRLGNEVVLYDRWNGSLHMLNPTAATIWSGLKTGLEEEELIEKLASEYPEMDAETLRQDYQQTVEQFRELGILEA